MRVLSQFFANGFTSYEILLVSKAMLYILNDGSCADLVMSCSFGDLVMSCSFADLVMSCSFGDLVMSLFWLKTLYACITMPPMFVVLFPVY